MNPFTRLPPLPPGSTGERGFQTAEAAYDHAIANTKNSFAVLTAGNEYVWISPIEAYSARAAACLLSPIQVVKLVKRT